MGKYKKFWATLNEEQQKRVKRNSLEWYVYGVGVASVLIVEAMGVLY